MSYSTWVGDLYTHIASRGKDRWKKTDVSELKKDMLCPQCNEQMIVFASEYMNPQAYCFRCKEYFMRDYE